MNLNNLDKWLTVTANVGVLLGIIFLAVELQQNTSMMRAQTRDTMTEKIVNFYELNINNIEASNLFRDIENEAQMAQVDRASNEFRIYSLITLSQLRLWENELYQYQQGLYDQQEFESRRRLWAQYLSSESPQGQARRAIWANNRGFFSQDFVEIVESLTQ